MPRTAILALAAGVLLAAANAPAANAGGAEKPVSIRAQGLTGDGGPPKPTPLITKSMCHNEVSTGVYD